MSLQLIGLCSMPIQAKELSVQVGQFVKLGKLNGTPLYWLVVDSDENVATLMCYRNIGEMICNKDAKESAKWEGSEMKKYLNTQFYNHAFSVDERELLVNYKLEDTDKVYIPSLEELGLKNGTTKILANNDSVKISESAKATYAGKAFKPIDFSLLKKDNGEEWSFATRNADEKMVRLATTKINKKTELVYTSGTMKSYVRPVIKISKHLENDNLAFILTEAQLEPNTGKKVMLHNLQYNIKSIHVNGIALDLNDATPKIYEGVTLVPVELICTKLGAEVDYNVINETMIIKKNASIIMLKVGSKMATVNNKMVDMGYVLRTFDEKAYVPLRFIVEQLQGETKYEKGVIDIRTRN